MILLGLDVHLNSTVVAAINKDMEIIMLKEMEDDELIKYVKDIKEAIIAIDAPLGLNLGLMDDESYRRKIGVAPGVHYNKKVSEYELARRGLNVFSTPGKIRDIKGWKRWMKKGLELYKKLKDLGYEKINEKNYCQLKKGMIEVFPHASFITLSGRKLESKAKDKGQKERIKLLEDLGFNRVGNIITGTKSEKADKIDALVAAYTALAIYKNKATFLGDVKEGQIAVPVSKIEESYGKRK